MNVTQIFCDADDFCQRFIPDWEQRQLEPDEKTKTRARARSVCERKSLRWWFVIIFLATGRSNGSIRDWFKSTGWQTFLVCQATTVLLN